MVVRFIVFLTSATLICRGTDISKCSRESLGFRDNDSRLFTVSFKHFSYFCLCMYVHCCQRSFFFIYLARTKELAKHSSSFSKYRRGELFQLHVATPFYASCPMSLYKVGQETGSAGSSFPAGAQRVFFFSDSAQQTLLFLLVRVIVYKFSTLRFCHGNQTKWPLVIKHINWIDNYQMIMTAKYCSCYFTCYGENAI